MTRRPRILIILRDVERRQDLALVLERAGYVVEHAAGQRDGLRTMYVIHPDLIVLDLFQGTDPGWETYERIRLFTDTPVILVGSRGDALNPRAGLDPQRLGFVDYPPNSQQILDMIKGRLAPVPSKARLVRRRAKLAVPADV
jgi:DNA-binding response OmpR family regulator